MNQPRTLLAFSIANSERGEEGFVTERIKKLRRAELAKNQVWEAALVLENRMNFLTGKKWRQAS